MLVTCCSTFSKASLLCLLVISVSFISGEGTYDATLPFSVFRKNNSSFWCPKRCVCSMQEKIIDCSSLQLKNVPTLPPSTKRLYLHNNLLTSLQDSLRSCGQLTYLILAENRIKDLYAEEFLGLYSLKYLILDGNSISQLSSTTFRGLTAIETISLARNQLVSLPGDVFMGNTQLTLINLQGNKIQDIHKDAFKGMPHLTALNLEENYLEESVFVALQDHGKLSTLRMNSNRLSRLPRKSLSLDSLKILTLHNNHIAELPQVLMENCSSLEILTLHRNSIVGVSKSFFNGCTSLTKIHFQKNRLRGLSPGVLAVTTSLKEIYLCDNQFSAVVPGVFQNLNHLLSIHLERNEISFVAKDAFTGLPILEAIYLHHNAIVQIQPGAFSQLPRLKYLVLYKNNIRTIHPSVLIPLPSLLKIQVDPFKCSCSLLPLATELKGLLLKGISCINDAGKLFSIANLKELCLGLEGDYFWQTIKNKASKLPHKGSPVNVPQGPTFQLSREQVLEQRVSQLEKTIAELKYKVLRLENLLNSEIRVCHRKVCFHDGVRFMPGDEWKSDGSIFCSCLHDGTVNCL